MTAKPEKKSKIFAISHKHWNNDSGKVSTTDVFIGHTTKSLTSAFDQFKKDLRDRVNCISEKAYSLTINDSELSIRQISTAKESDANYVVHQYMVKYDTKQNGWNI